MALSAIEGVIVSAGDDRDAISVYRKPTVG
jgi:hypothetical protein